ncbi:MAG: IS5 family transposase [Nitrosomonas sp.]|nr:MAG: IS5 family transposase [Nitrosomonas sp.]
MSFSEYDVTRRTRKGNFLKQIDQLIDWDSIEKAIAVYYAPASDATGRPAYPGLLLFKMLLTGIWNGGLSDESVEDMANSNLHVMRFLGLSLEDDVPDHSVLSRFRTRLTAAGAWDGLLARINEQIQAHDIMVRQGCHVDASITQSPRKPRTKPAYEIVSDREERNDEADARTAMQVIEVVQPGVDTEARWVRKGGHPVFGYKQHTVVDSNGLVLAVATTPANYHDSKPLLDLLDKADIRPGTRVHADKAYSSQKHRDALKSRGIKNGVQDKAARNNPLTRRQLQRNSLITKARYVVERTFGSQARWFNGKMLRYSGLAKAHAWHLLLAMAYNLKRLPKLFADRRMITQT